MKAGAALIAVLLLAASTAAAQEQRAATAERPDYSRDSLLFVLAEPPRPHVETPVRFHVGAVEFRALGSDWRLNYLPIMMPLSGSRLTTTQEWPDPFSLTRTVIATSPRAWRTQRAVNAEMRRIEQTDRARLRID